MSKGSVYVRNPTVYRIPSFRIQLDMEPLGNTCMRIHLSTVYTLLEKSERFRVSSYLPGRRDCAVAGPSGQHGSGGACTTL